MCTESCAQLGMVTSVLRVLPITVQGQAEEHTGRGAGRPLRGEAFSWLKPHAVSDCRGQLPPPADCARSPVPPAAGGGGAPLPSQAASQVSKAGSRNRRDNR